MFFPCLSAPINLSFTLRVCPIGDSTCRWGYVVLQTSECLRVLGTNGVGVIWVSLVCFLVPRYSQVSSCGRGMDLQGGATTQRFNCFVIWSAAVDWCRCFGIHWDFHWLPWAWSPGHCERPTMSPQEEDTGIHLLASLQVTAFQQVWEPSQCL